MRRRLRYELVHVLLLDEYLSPGPRVVPTCLSNFVSFTVLPFLIFGAG